MPARSPLFAVHQHAHATFRAVDGWELPAAYGDPIAECAAVRQSAGLIDGSHRGRLDVTGADRASFLHRLCSNDINRLRPGQGA